MLSISGRNLLFVDNIGLKDAELWKSTQSTFFDKKKFWFIYIICYAWCNAVMWREKQSAIVM